MLQPVILVNHKFIKVVNRTVFTPRCHWAYTYSVHPRPGPRPLPQVTLGYIQDLLYKQALMYRWFNVKLLFQKVVQR